MNILRRSFRFFSEHILLTVSIPVAGVLLGVAATHDLQWPGEPGNFSAAVAAHLQTAWENVVAVQSALAHGRVADIFATRLLGTVIAASIGFVLITQVFRRVRPKKAEFLKNIWRVIQFIPEYRGRIFGVLAAGTAIGAIGAGTPYLYKKIVDVITRLAYGRLAYDEAAETILQVLALFFFLRFALVVLGALQDKQADDLWLETVSTFRQRVFDNMTRMSIDYFEKTRAGEIMDRFGAIPSITQWLFSLTEGTLANILQMFFIIGVLLWRAPIIGGLMSAVLILNFYISYRTVGWAKPYRRGWQAMAGRMAGLLSEMVGNIATVRSFGGEPAVKQRYDETQEQWKVTRDMLHKVEWRSTLALNVVNAVGVSASVGLATYSALHGGMTAGDILLVLTLTQSLITTIAPIARQINQAGDIEASAERLVELLDVDTELADSHDAMDLVTIETIAFEHVGFAYPGKNAAAVHDVSFFLQDGETLALVGLSGSGKSTIVKLLMRFYDPTEGRILINGRDLREYKQRSVRARMGVVLQDVALFNDSIGENIAFARPGASAEAIQAAAAAAHADSFIRRMSDGYETLVGERGIKLSGGEKQRVAIARAILKDPELIILDEATSALDSESEVLVRQGLEQLVSGRSSVIIAHRLSTVMNADQILVLKEGRVVERGRHEDLANRDGGLYARLFEIQTQGWLEGLAA
ncbi:ABC transporter ATP-binding protein [Candidatus Methylospira mobilis]|uniref:ABC transporter ATP-binding protein n=1 Tax=Candidatus Methylospira mobilis TaxID=1808979 RepID=UPI001D1769C2|nr:ABC transporter ATP-binding protein [Candidatus Methylospira mobilis]